MKHYGTESIRLFRNSEHHSPILHSPRHQEFRSSVRCLRFRRPCHFPSFRCRTDYRCHYSCSYYPDEVICSHYASTKTSTDDFVRLSLVITQHALTTQTIAISDDGDTAEAITYVTGVHFGTGKWQGQHFNAWAKYTDSLKLIVGTGALPGSSGKWVIYKRGLVTMHREGNEAIMGS